MELIDGKGLRDKILAGLALEMKQNNLKPNLVILLVGEDEASLRYINQKQKAAVQIGAEAQLMQFPDSINQEEVIEKIEDLNQDKSVTGIIVQLPLPGNFDKEKVLGSIARSKDVDGLGKDSQFKPATPLGVMEILRQYQVQIKDMTAVVIGQSELVGLPLSAMLEDSGSKVIRIDVNTPRPIDPLVQQGDIVVSSVGQINLVIGSMIKPGAVVIDVGTNINPEGRLVGDVDFENVKVKASLITPVPGGVGPMTVASLMKNLVLAASIDKLNS